MSLDRRWGPRYPEDRLEIYNAPRHNRDFTGREKILWRIHQAFTDGGEGTRVALRGSGGMGKTQTALEYVHRYKGEYDIVWWVRATPRSQARNDFAKLADALRVERDAGDVLRGRIEAAKLALLDRNRWLVVLDGAEDPEDLDILLPEGPGHLLVTTPRAEWTRWCPDMIELPPFDRAESVDLACRRSRRLTRDGADRLAEAVEDHPLLMDQTAAWLKLNQTADIGAYVRRIEQGDPHSMPVEPTGDYGKKFQAVWGQTVNTLREKHPSAYELLVLFAFFSPDVVPVGLVQAARAADLPAHLRSFVTEPTSWDPALRVLSEATSMGREYQDRSTGLQTVGVLRMHGLFHRFVRGHLSAEEARSASQTASRVLVAADPRRPADRIHWPRYAELIQHLEPTGAVRSTDPDVRTLVLNCIEYLRIRGEYKEGRHLSRDALEAWVPASGETDPYVLTAVNQLANMERRLGNYRSAELIGRDALDRVTGTTECTGEQVLIAKNGLGGTLMALGRYEEAYALYEDAVAQAVSVTGADDSPRSLQMRSNLAIALRLLGRYEDSLSQQRAVLQARLAVNGDTDAHTLHAALQTAWALRLLGRYSEALGIQEHNFQLQTEIRGSNHDETLLAQHNLGLCLRREGSYLRAQSLMREAKDRMLRRRGAAHPDVLMMETDYGMLLRDMGDLEGAQKAVESAHARYRDLLGDDHPYTAGTLDNCALVQGDRGDHAGALVRAERSVAGMERALGPAHVWSIGCAMNMATALARAGEPDRAAALGRDGLARARTAVGDTHVLTLNLAAGLAQDLEATGQHAEAESVRQKAVQQLASNFFEEHRQVRYMLEGRRPYWDFEPQML
ncbi:FxSxx-COOH system tetratricopeptide repeat protein [Streptomyces sp. MBT33]|uniref:FxSxx-COOH system tetratricopeptide repeat protein n=1 Tax=Streptomyces sp. MBT33 TaxID=1488363 RepID=UPI00190D0B00|nr:FxSxx-COOH system tetratricopeptide repeat protein [Streptomyces sp. MBT33]MBK3645005.1 tetratricopeptide repeat protein [Streptomyces sp. MBT33]